MSYFKKTWDFKVCPTFLIARSIPVVSQGSVHIPQPRDSLPSWAQFMCSSDPVQWSQRGVPAWSPCAESLRDPTNVFLRDPAKVSFPLQDSYADLILDTDPESVQELGSDMVVAIKSLWYDSGVQLCYDRRREFQLADSCK